MAETENMGILDEIQYLVSDKLQVPSADKKSPAVGSNATLNQVGKAGNKKAGNKDPKQGNLMSFFKRV